MTTVSKQECVSCEAESYTRNNYFTGKLMVERDFTDEQRYFMEKMRLHHQRLHGTGVVCGLQIEQHTSPDCTARYVILQPGSAVDCCGKDILVAEQDVIDLWAFPQMQELIENTPLASGDPDDPSPIPRTLQLCIRYKECPTEEIPVLYDECGCDDTQCAPNRILETYEIDLLVDPEIDPAVPNQPALDWSSTINMAHAKSVLLHEATNRLYVLTADDNAGILHQISTDNFAVEASIALNRSGLAMAISPAGTELYVIVADAGGIAAGDAELQVFDVTGTNLSGVPPQTAVIAGTVNSQASMEVGADGRLVALFHTGALLRSWAPGLADLNPDKSRDDLAVNLAGLRLSNDEVHLYSAEPGSSNIHQFEITAADFAPDTFSGADPATAATDEVNAVVPVVDSGPEHLVVLDAANNELRLINRTGPSFVGKVDLVETPVDIAVSIGGHWAYALVSNGTDEFVRSVNLHSLRQGNAVVAGTPIPVGDAAQQIHISSAADTLFVPYTGDIIVDDSGGVAVLQIDEANCKDLLWPEDCPGCDTPDCLTLATIENYLPGFDVLDMPDIPPDATADITARKARINNDLGRQRLPSTQAIAEALACVLENCCCGSGGGEQGPAGPAGANGADGADGDDGQDGLGIDDVEVEIIPCGDEPSAELDEVTRVVTLKIPTNCNPDLTHICNINWRHGHDYPIKELFEVPDGQDHGLFDESFFLLDVRFDKFVVAKDLHSESVRVVLKLRSGAFSTLVEPDLIIEPGIFDSEVCSLKDFVPAPNEEFVNGFHLRMPREVLSLKQPLVVRVSILGDFIRDRKGLAVDADHLPNWLNNTVGVTPAEHTGDHIPGGRFESWFRILDRGEEELRGPSFDKLLTADTTNETLTVLRSSPIALRIAEIAEEIEVVDRVDVNVATRDELEGVRGIGPDLAEAIISARAGGPVTETRLLAIPGIGKKSFEKLRKHIIFSGEE